MIHLSVKKELTDKMWVRNCFVYEVTITGNGGCPHATEEKPREMPNNPKT